jgi:hypothetical protein
MNVLILVVLFVNKYKGLEGRSHSSIEHRLSFLLANDFKIEYKKLKIFKKNDTCSKNGKKRWSKEELAGLEKQIHLPVNEFDIPG